MDDVSTLRTLAAAAREEVARQRGGPELLADLDGRGIEERRTAVAAAGGSEVGERGTTVAVGLLGQAVVGWATASHDGGGTAVLEELYVLGPARGVGVGHSLLELVTDLLRTRGVSGLDAVALPGDRATKNFFEDHSMVARAITVRRTIGDTRG